LGRARGLYLAIRILRPSSESVDSFNDLTLRDNY
jgi:hypothetical protein